MRWRSCATRQWLWSQGKGPDQGVPERNQKGPALLNQGGRIPGQRYPDGVSHLLAGVPTGLALRTGPARRSDGTPPNGKQHPQKEVPSARIFPSGVHDVGGRAHHLQSGSQHHQGSINSRAGTSRALRTSGTTNRKSPCTNSDLPPDSGCPNDCRPDAQGGRYKGFRRRNRSFSECEESPHPAIACGVSGGFLPQRWTRRQLQGEGDAQETPTLLAWSSLR